MYRVGIVKAQDVVNARIRVTFTDRDQLESWWLPIVFAKTQDDKMYWIPDVGEQVVCMMDEYDEDGAVLGAIYSSADRPPAASADIIQWKSTDGATFKYDRSEHALEMNVPSGGTITISANGASITIDGSGDVLLVASGQIQLAGGGPGIARIGDETNCPAGIGHIATGSAKVNAG